MLQQPIKQIFMMKKTFTFTVLICVLASGACRKLIPVKLPENAVEVESHCSNGVMDADEDGTDCGPSCEPCFLSLPIFGTVPDVNTFDYIGTSVSFPAANVLSDTSSGVLVMTATTVTGGTLTITFGTTTPEVFTSYEITTSNPSATQVRVNFNSGTLYTAYSSSDEVHLNRVNGKYSLVFTEVFMSYSGGLGSLYTVTDAHINSFN
jgi:hypothetical protein